MLRNLLIIVCLLSSANVFAQKKGTAGLRTSERTFANDPNHPFKAIGSSLPPLRVVTMDGKVITNKEVDYHANLVVMLFNPTCEHCQDQTDLFEKNIFLFKKSKLLMIAAPTMGPYLQNFITTYHTDQYPGTIIVGLDSNSTIDKTFRYESLPQINIYDANRKLIKVFSGNRPIDSLKRYIQ